MKRADSPVWWGLKEVYVLDIELLLFPIVGDGWEVNYFPKAVNPATSGKLDAHFLIISFLSFFSASFISNFFLYSNSILDVKL